MKTIAVFALIVGLYAALVPAINCTVPAARNLTRTK